MTDNDTPVYYNIIPLVAVCSSGLVIITYLHPYLHVSSIIAHRGDRRVLVVIDRIANGISLHTNMANQIPMGKTGLGPRIMIT